MEATWTDHDHDHDHDLACLTWVLGRIILPVYCVSIHHCAPHQPPSFLLFTASSPHFPFTPPSYPPHLAVSVLVPDSILFISLHYSHLLPYFISYYLLAPAFIRSDCHGRDAQSLSLYRHPAIIIDATLIATTTVSRPQQHRHLASHPVGYPHSAAAPTSRGAYSFLRSLTCFFSERKHRYSQRCKYVSYPFIATQGFTLLRVGPRATSQSSVG